MKEFKFKIGSQDYTATVNEAEEGALEVVLNGKTYHVEIPEHHAARPVVRPAAVAAAPVAAARPAAAAGSASAVSAPLPGTITKVVAKAGQKVKRGDVLLVMEAMKMANDVTAEADGTVVKVCVSEGQSVNQGDALVELQADAAPVAAAPAPAAAPVAAPAAPKAAPAGTGAVTAPLPGTVTKFCVKVGDSVNAGDVVCKLEAMKMENDITAESAGTVKALCVAEGAQVQGGDALLQIG